MAFRDLHNLDLTLFLASHYQPAQNSIWLNLTRLSCAFVVVSLCKYRLHLPIPSWVTSQTFPLIFWMCLLLTWQYITIFFFFFLVTGITVLQCEYPMKRQNFATYVTPVSLRARIICCYSFYVTKVPFSVIYTVDN